ncbi:hypothetical protein NP013_21060, partial [Salmonella enterica]|nr:hypothetical protein [Salmonella enterica]
EWVHVQLHQQKGMISLSPPTICNSAHNISPEHQFRRKTHLPESHYGSHIRYKGLFVGNETSISLRQ